MNSNNIIAITGPTASGKSDLAIHLAQKLNSVILSVDSLAVYKEIDIASAKPSPAELAQVKHFGVNELYSNEKFSVIEFLKHFKEARYISSPEAVFRSAPLCRRSQSLHHPANPLF